MIEKNSNPFSLDSGRVPNVLVSSFRQVDDIIDAFSEESPAFHSSFISGIQGIGKTVSLTYIAKFFRGQDDWVVVELNPEKDMLLQLAAKLNEEKTLKIIFSNAKINLSFFGIGAEIEGADPIRELSVAVERMLVSLKRRRKKVLVIIDDIIPNENLRSFAYDYQMLVRQDLPVFLLVTSLYDNMQALQDSNSLSYLSRIPRISLASLDINLIAEQYSLFFQICPEKASQMANMTNGYPFAFQLLGYLTWEYGCDSVRINTEFKRCLAEYVYDKVWENLSHKEQSFLYDIAKAKEDSKLVKMNRENSSHYFLYYRRLINKGIIRCGKSGCLDFALPSFDEYILEYE